MTLLSVAVGHGEPGPADRQPPPASPGRQRVPGGAVLTVAQLTQTLLQMPPDAIIEVWSLAGAHGPYEADVDVKVQPIHDHDQVPVAIAIVAARPDCSHTAGADDECWRRADVELIDRTGHRHPLCSAHADLVWEGDPHTRVTDVYGGQGGAGWEVAADLLDRRWGEDLAVASWVAHPARWQVPLPQQPIRLRAL